MLFSAVKYGKHFGNLGKIYGEYRFALAPNEQKVWKNFFRDSVWKVTKHYLREFWFAIPLFASFFPLRNWAHRTNERIYRKNPADFANDI